MCCEVPRECVWHKDVVKIRVNYSMENKLVVKSYTEGSGQRFDVQMEINEDWCFSGISTGMSALKYLHQLYQQWNWVQPQKVSRWLWAVWCSQHIQETGYHWKGPRQAWVQVNLMRFNKVKGKALQLCFGKPQYQYKLGDAEKDLR